MHRYLLKVNILGINNNNFSSKSLQNMSNQTFNAKLLAGHTEIYSPHRTNRSKGVI